MKRLVLLLLATTTAPLAGQVDAPLALGEARAGTLTAEARDSYPLELADDVFVFGRVDQRTVDAVVTVLGPDGDEVAVFDVLARGPEPFAFTSDGAGRYVVAVSASEGAAGAYEIVLQRSEPAATDPGARIDQLMAPFSGDDTPGAVVGVLDRGRIAFQRAYGMADLSFGIEHRVDTPTNIGSVTKQFTAMSILLLRKDGLLSLDDEVREHIPELPDFGTPVTIRNLLNHTGGYREIYNFLPMLGLELEDDIRRDEAIRIVQRQPELQAAPNSEYNYNNTGFILLSMIVERISGTTFPAFMEERVFGPLAMTGTRVKQEPGEIVAGASTPYVPGEEGGWRTARDLSASAGAGGIYTTFGDMTKWMLNYRDATVGGPESVALLTTRNVLAGGDTVPYGLGIGITERRGARVFTHTGGDTAHRTYFSYFPELESGIFLSSNNASFGASYGTVVPEIEELFFGDRLEPREASSNQDDGEEEEEEEEGDEQSAAPVGPTEDELSALLGRYYARELELWIEIRRGADGPELHRLRTGPIALTAAGGLAFTGSFPFASVEFVRAANGSITGLRAGNGRTKGVLFERR